LPHLN